MTDAVSKFENALVELVQSHLDDGIDPDQIRMVMVARMDDDFDEGTEKEASALWAKENPNKSVFACDEEEKQRYRARVRASKQT